MISHGNEDILTDLAPFTSCFGFTSSVLYGHSVTTVGCLFNSVWSIDVRGVRLKAYRYWKTR